jgi:UPF0176 protein
MSEHVIIAFYKFAKLKNLQDKQAALQLVCTNNQVKGNILLASEGINGTIAGPQTGIDAVLKAICSDPALTDLEYKVATAPHAPFYRMKVNLKKEIVTFGVPTDPTQLVGTYVEPEDWNACISDPSVVTIDTRNDYEVRIGSFEGAIDPNTESFGDFPEYAKQHLDPEKHTAVALYCTGGIRCEKATSYLIKQGFKNVYHLKGGILKYLEVVPKEESLWKGECFVFDQRVAVTHGLEIGTHTLCYACQTPLSAEDRTAPTYQKGISCPHCFDTRTEKDRTRFKQRERQIAIAIERGQTHLGAIPLVN